MTLLIFFTGSPFGSAPPPAPDTHDLAFDERKWRKYQQQLAKNREALLAREVARKDQLREQLLKLYRGVETPAPKETIAAEAKPSPAPVSITRPMLDIITGMYAAPDVRRMVREYNDLMLKEQMRLEMEDEEDIALILASIL